MWFIRCPVDAQIILTYDISTCTCFLRSSLFATHYDENYLNSIFGRYTKVENVCESRDPASKGIKVDCGVYFALPTLVITRRKRNMQSSLSTARGNEARISHSESSENLNLFVKDLLDQMKSQVSNVGNSIQGRMDEMGERLGDLEQSECNVVEFVIP